MKISFFRSLAKKLILAALMLCAGPAALADGVFVTALPRRPITFDPAVMYDRYSIMAAANIYESLVSFGTASYRADFQPALASVVPTRQNGLISDDGRVYTFPIRKGVKFHDGTTLTPEDVRYSLLRFMLTDRIEGPSPLLLMPILGIASTRGGDGRITLDFSEADRAVRVDGDNVVITLKKPYQMFLGVLASWPCITSKKWCVKNGEWDGTEATWKKFNNRPRENSYLTAHANGTGPFALETYDEATGQFTLASPDWYWRTPAVLDRLVFIIEPSELNRQVMLETGDIDYGEFTRASVNDLRNFPEITIEDDLPDYSLGRFVVFRFGVNTADNPMTGSGQLDGAGIPPDFFTNTDVRRGFAYAFDYSRLLTEALRGKGTRITTPAPRPDAPAKPFYTQDLKKAEAAFKTAFDGKVWEKGFRCDIEYPLDDTSSEALADILADSLKALNPKFELRRRPANDTTFKQDIRAGRAPLFIRSFEPDYPDYYTYAFGMLHSAGLIPQMQNYSNPQADRLVAELVYKTGAARAEVFAALDRLYDRDLPQLLFYTPVNFKAYRAGITGMNTNWGLWGMHNFPDYYGITKPVSGK